MPATPGPWYEGRYYACWICKYFVQISETYCNGFCCFHAPEKIDENLSAGVVGAPAGYLMFPLVNDPATGSCGDFAPATVAVSSEIPDPEPHGV